MLLQYIQYNRKCQHCLIQIKVVLSHFEKGSELCNLILINQNQIKGSISDTQYHIIIYSESIHLFIGPLVLKLIQQGEHISILEEPKKTKWEFNVGPKFWELDQKNKEELPETLRLEELFKTKHKESQTSEATEDIEIVNNKNQKIIIKGKKPNPCSLQPKTFEQFVTTIPNPFDYEGRAQAFQTGQFRKNYQSGYAPVELQSKHTDPEDQKNKQHFIRQKQSQANLNLKRTCGVSYVKVSESQQHNVSHIFKKLPPLVFQCSSGCQNLEGWDDKMDQLFDFLFKGKSIMVCTLFQCHEESVLREYLLNPEQRNVGKVLIVKKFQDLWFLFQDALALAIHLQYDEDHLLRSLIPNEQESFDQQLVDFVANSQIQICLLSKKSVSGRKAFLKSVGLWNDQESVKEVQDTCESSTRIILSAPKFDLDHTTTAEHLFQQFSAAFNKPPPATTTVTKQQKKVDKSDDKRNKKMRSKQMENSDIKSNAGASDQLIYFLTKEDGYNNINTCSIRMELYVQQEKWNNATQYNKQLLNAFIKRAEYHIAQKIMVKMMNKRFKAFSVGISYLQKYSIKIKEIDTSKCIAKIVENNSQWSYDFKDFTNLKPYKLQQKYPAINLDILRIPREQRDNQKEMLYLQLPLYCITTRDSFAYDLIEKISYVSFGGRKVKKIEYFFDPNNCPANFKGTFLKMFPNYQVGCTAYEEYFTHEELLAIESNVYDMELKAFNGQFLPMTAQISFASSNHQTTVKRTKFFFGYRYMWTKCQLAEPHSMVAAGVRRDVSPQPEWMKTLVRQLENDEVVPKDFINSIACNIYHDGKEGLAQHFDDAVRFKQPIFTIRIFSDCRLSFGSQFYGFCNGAFAVPLPRGCILVMEEGSYAANAIKHCVRPCDMTGKSAAIILRQMHEQVTQEAIKYDEMVDFPAFFSTLSTHEDSVPFGEQKRIEAELLNH